MNVGSGERSPEDFNRLKSVILAQGDQKVAKHAGVTTRSLKEKRLRAEGKLRAAIDEYNAVSGINEAVLILNVWTNENRFANFIYEAEACDGLSIRDFIESDNFHADESLHDNLDRFTRYRTQRWYEWARANQHRRVEAQDFNPPNTNPLDKVNNPKRKT